MELTRLAAEAASFIFNVSLRSLLLFFAAGLLLLFLRRASAAGRHLLWTMTMGSLLLLPVLCACLPRWDAPVLSSRATASLKTTASRQAAANVHRLPIALLPKPPLALPDDSAVDTESAALGKTPVSAKRVKAESQATSTPHRLASQTSIPVAVPQASRPAPLHSQSFGPAKSASTPTPGASAAEWLVGLWLIGVLIVFCRTVFSLLAARQLLRGSRLVTEGALVEAAMEASSRLSLSTPMIIKAGTATLPVAVPMTFGVVRPVVLMPMEAAVWPAERLRVVFLHEAYLVPSTVTGAARQQRIAAVFHDPASPPSQLWSYSFNRALSGLSLGQIDNPNMIVAVFEGSQGVRNASDGGKSVPQPGRHSGGSDFLFADGHTKWLRAEYTPLLVAKFNPPVIDSSGNLAYSTQPQNTTGWFSPVNPEARQKIPIQGQAYDRRTMKPLSSTFVIFSQSPKKITVGSVWPSSFTNKAGRFQSILYPGKNYLMVLENNRFRFVGKTLSYIANGNEGSVSTQGTKVGLPRAAQSDYILRWSLPRAYALKMSSTPNNDNGIDIVSFVPVARSTSRQEYTYPGTMPLWTRK